MKLGRLLVTPELGTDYAHIYRAAVGVNWSLEYSYLFSPQPREWSYIDWFENIYVAVRSEYGDRLIITQETMWINVADELKSKIVKSASEVEQRLQDRAIHRESALCEEQEKEEYRKLSNEAALAFRKKDYKKVAYLLSSTHLQLSMADEKKLDYACKKLKT